jgi:hypothetical protein
LSGKRNHQPAFANYINPGNPQCPSKEKASGSTKIRLSMAAEETRFGKGSWLLRRKFMNMFFIEEK